ncbi:NRAMP family divalent metal transporter [Mucilaginibacter agri]|uniref:NRAMP family divalent metal transporter n=1 Tax=Mucilaginibacter agri TaxID=2695265 RepID=UPI00293BF6B5|nr:divalent metal cation transporter [Mucilaginibacter agri]
MYLFVPFFGQVNWYSTFKATFVPTIEWNKNYLEILVGILGTTISPYLFFWQATMEAEDIKKKNQVIVVDKRMIGTMQKDIDLGMFFSNLVMYFIILTCGTVLHSNGMFQIDTVEQAATALKPIAGKFASLLFSIGIIGTGFLAIPVLSGSLSYMFAETFNWKEGLDKKIFEAKPFYSVIIISLVIGLLINFVVLSPVKALLYSAVLYGLTAPVIIAIVIHIGNNKIVMGKFTNGIISNVLGVITFLVMTASAVALLYFQF